MQEVNQVQTDNEKDINDVFSDLLLSEESLIKEGYNEGYEIGKAQGNVEAYHLGYHRGAELGAEIGYFASFTDSYLNYYEHNSAANSEKVVKELTILKDMIATFPKHNDENVDILQLVECIRAKFKKVCAMLKIHSPFPEIDQLSF